MRSAQFPLQRPKIIYLITELIAAFHRINLASYETVRGRKNRRGEYEHQPAITEFNAKPKITVR